MIKFSIKKILNYFGWSLIKINRKTVSFYGKPDINHIKIINSSMEFPFGCS